MKTIRLNNGHYIPVIGFGAGTAWFKRGDGPQTLNTKLLDAMKSAMTAGFKHIDLAEMYGTDAETALALADLKLPRDSLFITHKLLKSLPDVKGTTSKLIGDLKVDYLDLLLIHSPFLPPQAEGKLESIWKELEELVDSKVVKSIGLSNFRIEDIKQILQFARIKPVINQIEYHPYLQQHDLVEFCKANDIQVAGYSELMSLTHKKGGPLDPVVSHFAESKGVSESQILISWGLQKGIIVITTSSNPERLQTCVDLALEDPLLSPEEIYAIDTAGLRLSHRQFWQKEFGFTPSDK